MRATRLGHVLFAVGLAGLGLLSLIFDDFALNWQPVPAGLPGRAWLAYASGTLLLAGGIGLLVPRIATGSAFLLTAFVISWLLLLQVPRVAAAPGNAGVWLGFGENLLLAAGGAVLVGSLARRRNFARPTALASERGTEIARLLFGLSLPLIGLSHFVYVDATASMVPGWLPFPRAIAYLTGSGHIAAGIALLFGVVPRLAATLEAAMLSLFVLLLHVPSVLAAPRDRLQWTMLCIACAYTGAAWATAGSFRVMPWRGMRWNAPQTKPAQGLT